MNNMVTSTDKQQCALVDVVDLSIHCAEDCIVECLSLALYKGWPITILGETGSGKSLLAQAIMGALPSEITSQGSVSLFGEQTLSQAQREAYWGKKIAMLPQEPWLALDPIMRAAKQISLVQHLVNEKSQLQSQQLAQQQLCEFGLANDAKKIPSQLSGGMAQRLSYLCATAAGGEVLIADEPTKGLDASRKKQIIALLKQHSEQGGLLTITHDIDVADALGGEMIVMRSGKIVERGKASSILRKPQSSYAKKLIAAQHYSLPEITRHTQPEELIKCTQVVKSRGGKCLFNKLNLTIAQGEIVGLIGDSGMGKSTLADITLGLVKADSGDIWRCNSLKKGKMLKLYQDPPAAFAQTITLGTNLDDLCQLHNLDRAPIAGLMDNLQLDALLLSRLPAQVSGGELQRFAILRALLMKPKLLIADEPTSRLDPITAAATMRLLIEQTQIVGCALLLISHDLALIENLCDKVINIADHV